MSDVGKGMLIILVILYIVSPIDFAPGPVDNAIVLLLGLAAAKKETMRDKIPNAHHNKNGELL
ncbi:MAG: hypothetical protein MSH13_04180 [Ruminococcus callidus]|nr:hypothetical protein [Ruminococcus callidus]MDY3656067.1 hypothetical protein [Ruminococcus callidus]